MRVFRPTATFKKQARFAAILWTLLIFMLCFLPGREIPDLRVPLIDKWVHFILFGVYSFLWCCAFPSRRTGPLLAIFISGVLLGYGVECIQGMLAFLGRSKDNMDALADGIGSGLGVLLFLCLYIMAEKNAGKRHEG